ncbi:MAG TPA: hypothetical protein VKN64_07715 [Halanaerobiales bacterium]|nr:hypothetical protein [Halanaerobiales bacterium]
MSIQRRNSNGVLQEENQDDSTYYISQGTGVYKMGIYNCTWTAGDAGDILVVRFSYKNVDEHSSNSMTFETGTIDAEVITPISIITSNLPTINIVGYTKDKISDEVGYQTSTVTFQSDQDLVEWEARADGTGHGSGLLVGSGGSVTANTDVTFDVDYTELTQGDKTYQINVYGKNSDGLWSDS